MAGRAGVPPEEYAAFMPGTWFLSLEEAQKRFEKGEALDSLYGSGKVADDVQRRATRSTRSRSRWRRTSTARCRKRRSRRGRSQRGRRRRTASSVNKRQHMRGAWSRSAGGARRAPAARLLRWRRS